MALQSSGAISLADIAAEFGGAAPHAISEYYGAAAGIPSSGQISFSNFYGKSAASPIVATGGTVSTVGSYKYHTFTTTYGATTPNTFQITATASGSLSNTVQVLIVAGGGLGGYTYSAYGGGGGGAGGMVQSSFSASVTSYAVWVGAWHNDSYIVPSAGTATAKYGGRGFNSGSYPTPGGSGGGGSYLYAGAAGTSGQGNAGGGNTAYATGGGGGGAGGAGSGSTGGIGAVWVNGTRYAGGGGGAANGSGGAGGGGSSSGGVGGAGTFYGGGSAGGSGSVGLPYQGIVIFRYQIS